MPCIMDLSSLATEMAHVAGGCHIDIAVLEDGESYDTINLIKRSYTTGLCKIFNPIFFEV